MPDLTMKRSSLLFALLLLMQVTSAAACEFKTRAEEAVDTKLEHAIAATNAAVRDPALELYLWTAENVAPSETAIPVYHIRPDPKRPIVAEVPAGCRAIVLNGVMFEKNFAVLSADNELMESKDISMMMFLLLHEIGHIKNEHYGAFLPDADKAFVNNDPTQSKTHERQADEFVAEVLKREGERLGTNTPPIDDYDLYWETTNTILFLSSLSFTVSVQNTLNCPFCRSLGDPRIFWDHSQSHPNFEYRLLLINHAISSTPESQQLLDEYERTRSQLDNRQPEILYQADDLTEVCTDPQFQDLALCD